MFFIVFKDKHKIKLGKTSEREKGMGKHNMPKDWVNNLISITNIKEKETHSVKITDHLLCIKTFN